MADRNLLDPKNNELIPSVDDPPADVPELAPGYEESKPAAVDSLEEALRTTTVDPCGFGGGLQLQRGEDGGLKVFKGDRIIRDLFSLEPAELQTIRKYVEGSR